MRILFLSRSTLFSQPGGDTLQVVQTAHYLQKLGCEVDIDISGQKPELQKFDLIHFYNLIRPADLKHVLKSGIPLVVSSIYHDYSEFDGHHRGGFSEILYRIFGKFGLEYLKTIARWINGSDRFPGFRYLLVGQKRSMQHLLKRSSFLIATSLQEIDLIKEDLGSIPPAQKINLGSEHVVDENRQFPRKGVLCAARIEGPKNQLNLIRAMKGLNMPLVLTGKVAANQQDYLEQCKSEADENVVLTGHISKEELAEKFSKAKVHALISYYETTGLSTVEALKMGCQAVITNRGAQTEIFQNHAFYCNPDDVASIRKAIEEALQCNTDHREWVKQNFSWEKAAREILDIYKMVIHKPKP